MPTKIKFAIECDYICNIKTEVHAHFMNCCAHSQSTLWIHEHGQVFTETVGVLNLALNLVLEYSSTGGAIFVRYSSTCTTFG